MGSQLKQLILVASPSGGGKSTFIAKVLQDLPRLTDTITVTTRPMRKGESEGHPYFFVTLEQFEAMKSKGKLAEWAKVHTHFYGTPMEQLNSIWAQGQVPIMDIDVQGVESLSRRFPQATTIFLLPPSIDVLRQRIIGRLPSIPPDLDVRMENARNEVAQAPKFDYQILNDNLDRAYAEFKKIIADLLNKK